MRLLREQLEQLVEQARRDTPLETCGLIAGQDDRVLVVYPMKNVDDQPQIRYLADPHEQLHALRDIDDHGWELLGIYHSHPASPAYPSPTDISRAFYPDAAYLLISLMDPEQVVVRGYRITDGEVKEITLEIEDPDESPRTHSRSTPQRASRSRAGRAVATLSKRRPHRGGARRTRGRVSKQV